MFIKFKVYFTDFLQCTELITRKRLKRRKYETVPFAKIIRGVHCVVKHSQIQCGCVILSKIQCRGGSLRE